jgi:hypothetical protein
MIDIGEPHYLAERYAAIGFNGIACRRGEY